MTTEWDNELLPPARAAVDHSSLKLIVGACAVGALVVLVCGGGLSFLVLRPAEMPEVITETRAQKRAALHNAFSSTGDELDDATRSQLEAFFDRVIEVTSEGDEQDFRRLVDRERLYAAMKASGRMPAQWAVIEDWISQDALWNVWIPCYATRYRIVFAEPVATNEREEVVVYGYFWDSVDDVDEMRWWLVKGPAGWRVYDWELLQFGLRASHELALYESVDTGDYFQLFQELEAADSARRSNDTAGLRRRMQRAEQLIDGVPEQLQDEARLWTAFHWSYAGDLDETARVVARISNHDDKPGAHVLQMLHAADLGRFDDVLDRAADYESAVGPNPNSAAARVNAAWQASRREALVQAGEAYLQLDPGHIETLEKFALALPSDEKSRLADHLPVDDNPESAVRDLAHELSYYGDVQSLRALEVHAAASLSVGLSAHIHGICEELLGRDLAAAESWRRAQRNGEEAASWRYEAAMSRLGRVIDAYHNADDPTDAFLRFAGTMDEERNDDGLQRLLTAHRPHREQDPWWWYYAAQTAQRAGDDQRALHDYGRGLQVAREVADAEAEAGLHQGRRALLVAHGDWREAYTESDAETCFAEVAAQLYATDRMDELAELVGLHERIAPDDVWTSYYAAVVAIDAGNHDHAERIIQKTVSTRRGDWPEEVSWEFKQLRTEARLAADDPLSAYALDPTDDTIDRILFYYRSRNDWARVNELAAHFRNESPDAAAAWTWGLDALWADEDYEGVDQLARSMPGAVWKEIESYRRYNAEEEIVRSRLRSGALDGIDVMPGGDEAVQSRHWQALAAVAGGRTSDALALLRHPTLADDGTLGFDPDVGATIMTEPAYRTWLEESPPRLPHLYESGWVVFLAEPPSINEDMIRRGLTTIPGEDLTVTRVETMDESVFHVHAKQAGASYVVVVGAGPFLHPAVWDGSNVDLDQGTRDALGRHAGWIACLALSPFDVPRRVPDTRVIQTYLTEHAIAVYRTDLMQLIGGSDSLAEFAARAGRNEPDMFAGTDVRLWYQSPADLREGAILERVRRRLTPVVCRLWCDEWSDLVAEVALAGGMVTETLPVELTKVAPQPYAGWELTGRLLEGSACVPELSAGRTIRFDVSNVIDWTLDGEQSAADEAREWWQRTRSRETTEFRQTTD